MMESGESSLQIQACLQSGQCRSCGYSIHKLFLLHISICNRTAGSEDTIAMKLPAIGVIGGDSHGKAIGVIGGDSHGKAIGVIGGDSHVKQLSKLEQRNALQQQQWQQPLPLEPQHQQQKHEQRQQRQLQQNDEEKRQRAQQLQQEENEEQLRDHELRRQPETQQEAQIEQRFREYDFPAENGRSFRISLLKKNVSEITPKENCEPGSNSSSVNSEAVRKSSGFISVLAPNMINDRIVSKLADNKKQGQVDDNDEGVHSLSNSEADGQQKICSGNQPTPAPLLVNQSPSEQLDCVQCGEVYPGQMALNQHIEDKHWKCPGYRCVLCGSVHVSKNSLHSHMSRHHRGVSQKDVPLVQLPAPFDPDVASSLLAQFGIQTSAHDLLARHKRSLRGSSELLPTSSPALDDVKPLIVGQKVVEASSTTLTTTTAAAAELIRSVGGVSSAGGGGGASSGHARPRGGGGGELEPETRRRPLDGVTAKADVINVAMVTPIQRAHVVAADHNYNEVSDDSSDKTNAASINQPAAAAAAAAATSIGSKKASKQSAQNSSGTAPLIVRKEPNEEKEQSPAKMTKASVVEKYKKAPPPTPTSDTSSESDNPFMNSDGLFWCRFCNKTLPSFATSRSKLQLHIVNCHFTNDLYSKFGSEYTLEANGMRQCGRCQKQIVNKKKNMIEHMGLKHKELLGFLSELDAFLLFSSDSALVKQRAAAAGQTLAANDVKQEKESEDRLWEGRPKQASAWPSLKESKFDDGRSKEIKNAVQTKRNESASAFRCDLCGEDFNGQRALMDHIKESQCEERVSGSGESRRRRPSGGGVPSPPHGVPPPPHGVPSPPHGVPSPPHGVASLLHGIVSPPHGVVSPPHGGGNVEQPKRFKILQINRTNVRNANASLSQVANVLQTTMTNIGAEKTNTIITTANGYNPTITNAASVSSVNNVITSNVANNDIISNIEKYKGIAAAAANAVKASNVNAAINDSAANVNIAHVKDNFTTAAPEKTAEHGDEMEEGSGNSVQDKELLDEKEENLSPEIIEQIELIALHKCISCRAEIRGSMNRLKEHMVRSHHYITALLTLNKNEKKNCTLCSNVYKSRDALAYHLGIGHKKLPLLPLIMEALCNSKLLEKLSRAIKKRRDVQSGEFLKASQQAPQNVAEHNNNRTGGAKCGMDNVTEPNVQPVSMEKEDEQADLWCILCGAEFATQADIEGHMRDFHDREMGMMMSAAADDAVLSRTSSSSSDAADDSAANVGSDQLNRTKEIADNDTSLSSMQSATRQPSPKPSLKSSLESIQQVPTAVQTSAQSMQALVKATSITTLSTSATDRASEQTRSKSNELLLNCQLCSKVFSDGLQFNVHMKIIHHNQLQQATTARGLDQAPPSETPSRKRRSSSSGGNVADDNEDVDQTLTRPSEGRLSAKRRFRSAEIDVQRYSTATEKKSDWPERTAQAEHSPSEDEDVASFLRSSSYTSKRKKLSHTVQELKSLNQDKATTKLAPNFEELKKMNSEKTTSQNTMNESRDEKIEDKCEEDVENDCQEKNVKNVTEMGNDDQVKEHVQENKYEESEEEDIEGEEEDEDMDGEDMEDEDDMENEGEEDEDMEEGDVQEDEKMSQTDEELEEQDGENSETEDDELEDEESESNEEETEDEEVDKLVRKNVGEEKGAQVFNIVTKISKDQKGKVNLEAKRFKQSEDENEDEAQEEESENDEDIEGEAYDQEAGSSQTDDIEGQEDVEKTENDEDMEDEGERERSVSEEDVDGMIGKMVDDMMEEDAKEEKVDKMKENKKFGREDATKKIKSASHEGKAKVQERRVSRREELSEESEDDDEPQTPALRTKRAAVAAAQTAQCAAAQAATRK